MNDSAQPGTSPTPAPRSESGLPDAVRPGTARRDGRSHPPAPPWLTSLAAGVRDGIPTQTSMILVPRPGARAAAVLILFGEGPDGPDVLLLQRAAEMRDHAGQPAFPGGAADEVDASRAATALREAEEEVGLDPTGVEILTATRPLYLGASHFLVTPVLAWWHTPSAVAAVDPAETSSVARVPVAELAAPENRFILRHPAGFHRPAFRVRGMVVWGFTAGVLDALLRVGGWEVPWDSETPVEDPDITAMVTAAMRANPALAALAEPRTPLDDADDTVGG